MKKRATKRGKVEQQRQVTTNELAQVQGGAGWVQSVEGGGAIADATMQNDVNPQ